MNTIIKIDRLLPKVGYYISLGGIILILMWIGIFKFTPTEAEAIKPLVSNHFLMSWLYDVMSVQQVSNLFGVIEIMTAILLLLSLKFNRLRPFAALGLLGMFLSTLSFLFTTPGMWKMVDGIPVTDFFILKDIPMLGLAFMYLQRPPRASRVK